MPIHGPNTSLSYSDIITVFSAGSLADLRGDGWYLGNVNVTNSLEIYDIPGKYTYICPNSSGSIKFEISGAGGGGGGADNNPGHDGYPGNKLTGTYGFQAGDIITIYVGAGGIAGEGMLGNAQGGAGGGFDPALLVNPYAGGNGGNSGPTPYSGAGGGGGGASAILINNVPIAVAAGGGGGGGGGRSSGGADSVVVGASTNSGEAGQSHLTNGGGGGGGGGGNFGGLGGAVQVGDSGGISGSSGSDLLPVGWVSVPLENGGKGADGLSDNQTNGIRGYIRLVINANNLQEGNFNTTNIKFSDFFNKSAATPATTGNEIYDVNGTFTFTIPVYKNSFSIEAWGAGGGGGGFSPGIKGQDTTIDLLGYEILNAGGGGGGGVGLRQIYGGGGLGGIPVGGNTVGSRRGQQGGSFPITGNNAGGFSPNGGIGGANAATTNANVVYHGGDGVAPGGGGGGFYTRDPSYYAGGGGGGGAYIIYGPADPTLFAAGTDITLNVGKGGDGGLLDTDQVGGAGADGKIILTWT